MHPMKAVYLAAVLAILFGTACSGQSGRSMTDPQGRITFQLPEDWEAAAGSSETRFRPAASPGSSVQVNTVDKGSAGLERRRDAWLDFQRKNGAEILYSEAWSTAHFDGVAYAHTGEGLTGEIVWHHVLLEGDDYIVATNLQASGDSAETMLPVYREIVASIEPAKP